MSVNRIQKLLFSEYCEFEDMVIVESPFAQTTRGGQGLRQVHLGLTSSKLVLATDVLPKATESLMLYLPGVDPDVETFELVAIYPIECVNLSIFHRKKRQSLKARFSNNKVLYFELGGFEKRRMFWNLWCERIKFLIPDTLSSSHSETSVATSSTNSTLYLQTSKHIVNEDGIRQIWFEYGCRRNSPKWTDRSLFIGGNEDFMYMPKMELPKCSDFVHQHNKPKKCTFDKPNDTNEVSNCINRFGSNIVDNCNSALFLPAENFLVKQKFSRSTTGSADVFTLYKAIPLKNSLMAFTFPDIAENCIKLWECYALRNLKKKHKRRYALAPKPHFLHGLGPWNVSPGERFSVQIKRAASLVNLKRQPAESELRLPVSKRQLVASVSCETINREEKRIDVSIIKAAPKTPVVFFWTPEYWYRPRSARDAYMELQNHLNKIRMYREEKQDEKKKSYRLFRKKRKKNKPCIENNSDEDSERKKGNRRGGSKNFLSVFSREETYNKAHKTKPETSLQYLKKMLKMEVSLTAWDFDSTTLAYQITLIDKELFIKIPSIELGVLMWQQSSKNAPNVGALIAFSHRLSCLVVTEILRTDSEKIRARLLTRFINVAEKCNRISNFQSCKSVLNGLQCPSVYRLQATWNYLRKQHSTKYLIFEQLCRQYRDPRLHAYQNAFQHASQTLPYLPYIGDIIARMLGHTPNYNEMNSSKGASNINTPNVQNNQEPKKLNTNQRANTNILKKVLLRLKIVQTSEDSEMANSIHSSESGKSLLCGSSSSKKHTSLAGYYKSLNLYEDNRLAKLREVIEVLDKYQYAAAHYCIDRNELAREYLLKARYREERENFLNSFKVEPIDEFSYK